MIRTATRLPYKLLPWLLPLLLWQLAALFAQSPLLPSPAAVFIRLMDEAASGELWQHLSATLVRVLITFSLAMLLGVLLGVAMGRSARLNRWLDPLLITLLNIPALVTIILLYIWIGLNEWAALLAVMLNKVPNVAVGLREGARSLDTEYESVAQLYRLTLRQRLTAIWLPQLSPYLLAAARSGLALIWKIVLVVELMGRSQGVGFQLHLGFQLFDVTLILAYSLSFIAVIQLVEWTLLQPWEQRQRHWQTQGAP